MTRAFILSILWPIATTAMGQSTWTFSAGTSDMHTRILDIVPFDSGYAAVLVSNTLDQSSFTQSTVIMMDANGDMLQERLIRNEEYGVSGNDLLLLPNGHLMLVGSIKNVSNSGYFFTQTLDHDLSTMDSTVYDDQLLHAPFVDNAMVTTAGNIVFGGSSMITPDLIFDHFVLYHVDASGMLLNEYHRTNSDMLIPRDVVQIAADSIIVGTMGVPDTGFAQWSFASYLKFGTDLSPAGGFLSEPYDGNAAPVSFSNTIADQLHLQRLPSGDLLVSGKPRAELRTVVVRLSPTGEWRSFFRAASMYPFDHPAAYNAITTRNGQVMVASMENYFYGAHVGTPYLPDHPNQIRIFRLDTTLNLLCTNMVDGFAEDAYFWADRIVDTDDGGYIVCGGRFDQSAPNARMVGWAQKFGPEDCFVGVAEEREGPQHAVYPNPGSDRFTLNVNGPAVNATLHLFNANGQVVGVAPLVNNTITFDASGLAPGMYAYRVVDMQSKHLVSGRWSRTP